MTQINQNQKRKFLILVALFKKQTIMLNSLKLKEKYLVLVAELQLTAVENKIANIIIIVKKN